VQPSVIYGPQHPYGPYISIDRKDLDTLARTLWGEARGEGVAGMQAVAAVIMNRHKLAKQNAAYARQFGRSVAEICLKPYQFSAWLASDPNRFKMMTVSTSDPVFRDALRIAE